jgi:hypothetical protein
MPEMSASPNLKKGSGFICSAPEKAYKPHIKKTIAIPKVTIPGSHDPASAILAISSPAPKKRYQSAPPMMIAICKRTTSILNMPPKTRVLPDLLINAPFYKTYLIVWFEDDTIKIFVLPLI